MMNIHIEYGEHIIVAVRLAGCWSWYVTEKEHWFMDLPRFHQAFIDKGYDLSGDIDYGYRFDIPILNEHTASSFLACIKDEQVSVEALRAGLIKQLSKYGSDPEALAGWAPALLVDFDNKQLSSYFPEPASFEQYVPEGWTGHYENFTGQLPDPQKYWVINEHDYFANSWQ